MTARAIPPWANGLVTLYESEAASQFILYGNVNDRFATVKRGDGALGDLHDFLRDTMMPSFDVLLSYDLGNGIRIDRGGDVLAKWPGFREAPEPPRAPRQAIEWLTRFFRYAANLARLGQPAPCAGLVVKAAHLVAPALPGALNYDLNALALLMRDWASDELLARHNLVTWLVTDALSDLHPLLVNNPRAATVQVPLPSCDELHAAIELLAPRYPAAIASQDPANLAARFAGATLTSLEALLKTRHHEKEPIADADLVELRKEIVERDAGGLIEFIDSGRTLDDVHAQEKLKAWLRQDITLWRNGDVAALPMGYLICGPVGTGKTYLVECLAGEAGVPVVKLKNFRDKWVGSTEGNLEKIFRLLESLGRCIVFIDEADQALGKRDSGSNDAGLSGRVYSMFAEQMSRTSNRGRIVWVLASSRPDLIEVDLKRPGRVDVKVPIFPTTTVEESFSLIQALAKRRGMTLTDADRDALRALIPTLLTPGAAEALAVKLYRTVKTESLPPAEALRRALTGYQPPVPADVMQAQIALAAREATDIDFVPEPFRSLR